MPMLAKVTGCLRLLVSETTNEMRSRPPVNLSRFFSTASIPLPHSSEHLRLQKEIFEKHNIPVSRTMLPEGTRLIGFNVTREEPYSLITIPAYDPRILKAISDAEKKEWLDMVDKYEVSVAHYKLLCDITCLTKLSKNGVPVHYITPAILQIESYAPVVEALGIEGPEVDRIKDALLR